MSAGRLVSNCCTMKLLLIHACSCCFRWWWADHVP
jgi:hypothetical protein